MKISIPSFFTSLLFGLFIGLSGFLLLTTYSKFLNESIFKPELIGIGIIYLAFPVSIIFLIIKWRFIVIENDVISIIHPLRFKINTLKLNQVISVTWKLWGNSRTGDYLVLELLTKDKEKLNITDFEFQNFRTLETSILTSLNFKPNLKQRTKNRYEQAKGNLMFSILFIIMSIIIGYTSFNKMLETTSEDVRPTVIFVLCCLILLRLIFQLLDYSNRLRKKHNRV